MTLASRFGGGVRLIQFLTLLTACLIHGSLTQPRTLLERGRWRQMWCRIILHAMRLTLDVHGEFPTSGLLPCNHLSYLDALVLGSLTPAVFVSKAEVRRWPMVGSMCARGGTLFMNRESPRDAVRTNQAATQALLDGVPVVIFPEGTTTNGRIPLPFHPALFQPAVTAHAPVWPLALSYSFQDGRDASAQVAYFGDVRFIPHFMRFMRMRGLHASVRVAAEPASAPSRTSAAQSSWTATAHMLQLGPVAEPATSTPGSVSAAQSTVAQFA